MTALSATVGTGNIAGVATAIFIGGPGAVFWMWMTALVGMATKYGEAVLAVKYREVDELGNHVGGPMYYIRNGLGENWKWLGVLFALFGTVAAFGIGNTVQANSVADVLEANLAVPPLATGVVLAALTFLVIFGGVKRLADVAGKLVPFMAVVYVIGALFIIATNIDALPAALGTIVSDAFTGTAAAGGFAGSTVLMAIRFGVARGIFSNEAGLGTAPIAHAAARTTDPVRQGVVGMLGTFIDTIVICTMTALVIVMTGAWDKRQDRRRTVQPRLRAGTDRRQLRGDLRHGGVRLHHLARLVAVRRALRRVPVRRQGHLALPGAVDRRHSDRHHRQPEAPVAAGRRAQRPDGDSQPHRPAAAQPGDLQDHLGILQQERVGERIRGGAASPGPSFPLCSKGDSKSRPELGGEPGPYRGPILFTGWGLAR